jgi:hypothetical protein
MKKMNLSSRIFVMVACLGFGSLWSATCLQNRDFYQSLPTSIGREDQTTKFPFALNCDTVFVRKGVTTVVHPGTLLFFSKPTLNSVIKVEGTLIVKGTKHSYAYLSGSLDSGKTGWEAGPKPWGGIEVAEGGKLLMEYTGVMQAPTPVTTFSRRVNLVNCFFKGSSGIILPDGNLYPMESKWHTINNLDLEKDATDRKPFPQARPEGAISEKEKAALLAKKQSQHWTWKKTTGGLAALAVVGVGAVYFLMPVTADEPGVTKDNPLGPRPSGPVK